MPASLKLQATAAPVAPAPMISTSNSLLSVGFDNNSASLESMSAIKRLRFALDLQLKSTVKCLRHKVRPGRLHSSYVIHEATLSYWLKKRCLENFTLREAVITNGIENINPEFLLTTEQTSESLFDSGVNITRYPFQIETTLSLSKPYRSML